MKFFLKIVIAIRLLLALMAVFAFITVIGVWFGPKPVFPVLSVSTPDGVTLKYYNARVSSQDHCWKLLEKLESAIYLSCRNCSNIETSCSFELPPSHHIFFTEAPVARPMAKLPQGMMVFESSDNIIAEKVCDETIKVLGGGLSKSNISCIKPEEKHPYFRVESYSLSAASLSSALLAGILSLVFCFFSVYAIVRYENLHSHFSYDHLDSGPQKFHAVATPRIGGIAVAAGVFSGLLTLNIVGADFNPSDYSWLLVASMPAFIGGLAEDITKRVGVAARLLLTMLSGLLGSIFLGATLNRLGIPGVDVLLQWLPMSLFFTAFAVGGVANATNIIDGCNGLASGFGIISSIALACVAAANGDSLLAYCNLVMAGSLIGFFVWNWPSGRIFLGDGGAYFLGFWLAEMSILLVVRNSNVSVWFPFLVMVYPLVETLFSVYRRRFIHKSNPGLPDSFHLHQMLYKRLVRFSVGAKDQNLKTMKNSGVAPYFLFVVSVFSGYSVLFFSDGLKLFVGVVGFVVFYICVYKLMFRKRLPFFLDFVRLRDN